METWETVQSFAYEKTERGIVIWRCFSADDTAVIPETLEGFPVYAVAPYAFSAHMEEAELDRGIAAGRITVSRSLFDAPEKEERAPALCGERLRCVVFPNSVTSVGRYCFYNCARLERISFGGGLSDWGSGVVTGCHRVRSITVRAGADGMSFLQELLEEIPEALEVEYVEEDPEVRRKALLIFPEFYEEGVENTPARILETHIHGTGIRYRNCFKNRKLDLTQYDALFPYAKAQENGSLVARLAMNRLRYPLGLLGEAEKVYRNYVEEHFREYAALFVENRDMESIRWMISFLKEPGEGCGKVPGESISGEAAPAVTSSVKEFAEALVEEAGRRSFPEALGLAMEYCRSRETGRRKRRRLEL